MDIASAAVHRTIVAFDVEKYSSPERTDTHRLAVRSGLYDVVSNAFGEADIPWDECTRSDSGDGFVVLIPPDVPKIRVVDRLPHRLTAMLRRHNRTREAGARMRLRMAVHAGEVHYDRNGIVGESVNFTCRLLDAAELKAALAASAEDLAYIVSDPFHSGTVRHDLGLPPESFRRIHVSVKETDTHGWLNVTLPQAAARPHTPAKPAPEQSAQPKAFSLTELSRFVDILADIPELGTPDGRDHVLSLLPREMWTAIRRQSTPRTDLASIVTACRRYPDGMSRLVDAVRFVAAGTHAMAALDQLVAELRREAGS